MCRILGYLGPPISLDRLVLDPDHSMLVQSYQPRELKSAVLNGDGFGLGWHGPSESPSDDTRSPDIAPFVYRNILPMWNDRNLEDLCRYIQASSFVVNLRSATHKMPVDISNCQPFKYRQMLFVHNGLIENFSKTLQRPIREKLCDFAYRSIQGLTDSEHIFALLVHYLEMQPGIDIAEALHQTMKTLASMANAAEVRIAANIILSLPDRLIALRYDNQQAAPSLYLLKNSKLFPNSVILSSEGLWEDSREDSQEDSWQPYNQSELVSIDSELTIKSYATID
ncbi:ergothioneine biosynthesis protein EgtC [cf. Phormidesmis sp. LEGE 11477]|uniref:ergothioneine biosynthesis protein EgtC n=1 Tax=cf. Phormidesmis sp. LEGE 11477 TaxID=1828680 RepID=UPI00187F3247|nr:ergothioneine biosynthesis protein EgtC [cf. Phormidesmis sp. LEGE 11477]MBE9061344.1 ergothioneine biosynthesis protein EgtC [cf. Phormidesmis sp. LEGE 11477]